MQSTAVSVTDARWKALLFDVDGTLYHQAPLRRAMSVRLLRHGIVRPLQGWRTLRTLSAAQARTRGTTPRHLG